MTTEAATQKKKKKTQQPAPVTPYVPPAPANVRNYGDWGVEQAEADLAKSQAEGAGDYLKLPLGTSVLRFLPPAAGRSSPFVSVKQHFIEIPGGGKDKGVGFVCPKAHGGNRCPACERADRLKATGNKADFEAAKKLYPRTRHFANVVDRSDPDRGVVIFPFGKTIYEPLLALRKTEGNFVDPGPKGFDIKITKSGEGLNTEYMVTPARESSDLGCDEWLDELHDLEAEAKVLSYAEILEKLGADGGPPPEQPARHRSAGRGGDVGGGYSRGASRSGRTVEDDADQSGSGW